PADETLVDTKDVFAPAAPEGLLVLVEAAGSRLVWNPVLSGDLEGYRVYRQDSPGAGWRRIDGKLKEPSYVAPGAPKEARYAVTAVDRTGNESARGEAGGTP